MKQEIHMNLDDVQKLVLYGRAFSAEARIEILRLLCRGERNINEIAETLSLPASSAAAHVKVLEEAGLITTSLQPGVRGSMKVCEKALDTLKLELTSSHRAAERMEIINMPIGSYVDCLVEPTCGIVGEKGPIGQEDEPRCFYEPNRSEAQLLWFGKGYIEYRFPNSLLKKVQEKRMEISLEICSEDHEYNMAYPSDITLWVNGIEAGTWTCPSDYGGRRGMLNPAWWPDKNTQYGELKTWRFESDGTWIDEERVNTRKIQEYGLSDQDYISVRIGIKEDAAHPGGINLFGDGFGDYSQGIRLTFFY
ncbi:MAG: helix-turn-helix domain-containing protein [Lachnospiraceae bacterium]|nr:helix-turn-helix domain-containing protein [Lachnospiraceae bacterium]